MTDDSVKNFSKRKIAQPAHEEPASRKRSSQIALLLMGTMAVGGGAYALMPRETCDPSQPMTSEERLQCVQRNGSSSSSGGHGYSGNSGSSWGSSGGSSSSGRSNFASSSGSAGTSVAGKSSSTVARSGFGSFASHFSGGG